MERKPLFNAWTCELSGPLKKEAFEVEKEAFDLK
jgi:hypothetical protein